MTAKRVLAIVFAAALMAAASAAFAEGEALFSHDFHVNNAEQKCLDCHVPQPNGFPKVNKEKCKDCHGDEAPAYKLPRFQRLGIKAFPHSAHDKAFECTKCHSAMLTADYGDKPVMPKKECAECHSKNGLLAAEQQCVVCHGSNKKLEKPSDHLAANWLHTHGEQSEHREVDEHGKSCKLCHGAQACTRCHREIRPKNHTGLWRERMHGQVASWDRENCKTCHETGVCVRCHTTTRPMNHNGAWRSVHGLAAQTTDNETCMACHRASECAACHRKGN